MNDRIRKTKRLSRDQLEQAHQDHELQQAETRALRTCNRNGHRLRKRLRAASKAVREALREELNDARCRGAPVITLLLLFMVGCGLPPGFVEANRAAYDAIVPEYSAYVLADDELSDEDKERRDATTDAWDTALSEAEH